MFWRCGPPLCLRDPFDEALNLSKSDCLPLFDLKLFSFLNALFGVCVDKSSILAASIHYCDLIVGNFDFGMAWWNLSIFDYDGGLFSNSSDDILSFIKWDFINESRMIVENDVCSNRFLI